MAYNLIGDLFFSDIDRSPLPSGVYTLIGNQFYHVTNAGLMLSYDFPNNNNYFRDWHTLASSDSITVVRLPNNLKLIYHTKKQKTATTFIDITTGLIYDGYELSKLQITLGNFVTNADEFFMNWYEHFYWWR